MDLTKLEKPVIAERGARGATSDRRLYVQLLVFTDAHESADVAQALREQPFEGALYESLADPAGVGVAILHEDPAFFIDVLRPWLRAGPLKNATNQRELTMFGRTYALGYEDSLDEVLLRRPRRHLLDPDAPWAVWYPLRRAGSFTRLPREEQAAILREHALLGMSYGQHGLARDIRLACHGLDTRDNDFVIGLFARELVAASKLVEHMRSTVQTAQYIEKLGPFFVGKKVWCSTME